MMSSGDIELRSRRPRLRSGWDGADSVESLRVNFCSMIAFQQRFLLKFGLWCSQVIKDEPKKGFNVVQVPTAVLVGGLGIDKDKRSSYIVYKVGPDRGY